MLNTTFCQNRFTDDAYNIIARLKDEKTASKEKHEKQVLHDTLWSLHKEAQVLIRKLERWSRISACGFFTVDRSLVTSFLATTFTYWVILVQFTQSAEN